MQRDKLMNTSEKFLKFAAECEFMAQLTHNPNNKTVWRQMGRDRWIRDFRRKVWDIKFGLSF